ncbi:pullulanase [candidate division KSB1 bacterium]|nr:pullulanase [candidate division KSB1 bacterium]
MIRSAKINSLTIVDVQFHDIAVKPHKKDFEIIPGTRIHRLEAKDGMWRLHTDALDVTQTYHIRYHDVKKELQPDQVLDMFYSNKPLGCSWNEDNTIFRLFAPRAQKVWLLLYASAEAEKGVAHEMLRDSDGVWECLLPGHYFNQFYNYRVQGPQSPTEAFDPEILICDPYSHAVATRNEYQHRGRTLIIDHSGYDWEGDRPLGYSMEDLIIYECHVRDLTAHPSSGVAAELAGSYPGLVQTGNPGGLEYVKALGVNAVEFLPIHEFGNIELPYNVPADGIVNTWNPYSRNHWGYMTSYFFAPESYYAGGGTMQPGALSGAHGRQIQEFKDVVKAFHRAGIAVILDVVYNHVSQYDQNCFKLIDKKYYFRLDDDQNYIATSGCGNDFMTERAMARRLILDSVTFWMREYHIDGFRFDLAAMIDWETVDAIAREARKINPDVILIAEPWGGGKYTPAKFSKHDWAAWNDQFRNGIKGQNPADGQSFIFGKWWGDHNMEKIKNYICGTLSADGGLFQKSSHAVNYLGSHDDHCLGDFIRIGCGEVGLDEVVTDVEKNAGLTPRQMQINKLGALILFTSQGAVMMEEGNEFARSKRIVEADVPDPHVGRLDHNSYNKDNETNYLNYRHAEWNKELVDYYKGLIALRKKYTAFRRSPKSCIKFLQSPNAFALSYIIDRNHNHDGVDLLVLLNAHAEESATFELPEGTWSALVDDEKAGTEIIKVGMEKTIWVPAASGMVLIKK